MGHAKTFCIDCTWDSISFGRKLNFKNVYEEDGYSLSNADGELSRILQPMDLG
jgi:hypothetical protein